MYMLTFCFFFPPISHSMQQWGLLIAFIELIKNQRYQFWKHEFTRCATETEKFFESVANLACRLHLLLREMVILNSDEGILMHDVTCNGRFFTDIRIIGYFLDFSMFSGQKSSVLHHGDLMI